MDPSVLARVEQLGDLELALLVSTIAHVHCLFSTARDGVRELQEELRRSWIELFGVQPAVVECSATTTVDGFTEGVLVDGHHGLLAPDFPPVRRSSGPPGCVGDTRIAEVVVATGLDQASEAVQLQAFELLRSGRIFTRSAMHVAPNDLIFITILSQPRARLSRHLHDRFGISHHHDPDPDRPPPCDDTRARTHPLFSPPEMRLLRSAAQDVELTAEIAQYLHDIVVFLRNSRYVKAGVTAAATRQLRKLARALAPLHGIDYVPPALVTLAARKIYAHRIVLARADNEKSLLWGSDPRAVEDLLDGVTVEWVLDEVLATVDMPW